MVILTAQSRLQSYQQVALVEQILVPEGQVIYLVWDLLLLYISFARLGLFAFALSQSCWQGLPMFFSVIGVCGGFCVDGALSVLLALESVPLYLDGPPSMDFNQKRQPCTNMADFVLLVPHIKYNRT